MDIKMKFMVYTGHLAVPVYEVLMVAGTTG
jgi:hypothetical protein